MTAQQLQSQALIRIARTGMQAAAIRWRVIRKDPLEREAAHNALQLAIRFRDMSLRWQAALNSELSRS